MSGKEKITELKIKEAARKIFQEKGFAGTKTRDIADAAGINLALLNYYFGSKKKLFDLIMLETMQGFFSGLISILNNEETSFREKIAACVDFYIDLLSENPNVATFILNTVRENPKAFISKIGLLETAKNSVFVRQFGAAVMNGEVPKLNPLHFILNLLGLIVFPFLVQPMITAASGLPSATYIEMLQERKRLIPLWISSMLTVS